MHRPLLRTIIVLTTLTPLACDSKDESAKAEGAVPSPVPASEGGRMTPGQLVRLLPAKVGEFSIYEPHGRFQDTPAVNSSMAKVLYVDAKNRSISVHLTDYIDGPEYLEAERQGMADGGAKQGLVSSAPLEGPQVEGFLAQMKGDGPEGRLQAIVGKRFHLRLGGNNGVSKDELDAFWKNSGLAAALAKPEAGAKELPEWAQKAKEDAYPEPPAKVVANAGAGGDNIDAVPDCGSLLSPADIQATCGQAVELKATGAADGKSQLCSEQGGGFIFLLSRLSDPDTARKSASVATGKSMGGSSAGIDDRTVYTKAWPTGGEVAVAPASNLLIELRSLSNLGKAPACSKDQVKKLAETVISRLPSPG